MTPRILLFDHPEDVSQEQFEKDLALLPAWRSKKALSYRFLADRVLCAKAYLLLMQGLKEEYGIEGPVKFALQKNGKPFLEEYPSIHFNISHCKNGVLCVLDDQPVGCDIELIPDRLDMDLCRESFNESEVSQIVSSNAPEIEFAKLWTRKEAAVKLTGQGIVDGIKDIFSLPQYSDIELETIVDADNGYAYSVCRQGGASVRDEDDVLEVASLAGHILLENGAEIYRVEDTMDRISTHFGVRSVNFFVLSNGIFTTGKTGYAKVEYIPFRGAQLAKVVAVDQVSRDLAKDKITIPQAKERLLAIRCRAAKPAWEQLLGSAVGSAGFCVIFGGGLMDAAAAFVAGLLLWAFVLFVSSPYLPKLLGNIAGGLLGTSLCILFHRLGFGSSLGNMIVGSLIPLIPGVAFINGIRDMADEDYIAGATRLMDAVMVFFYIAAGVVFAFLGDFLIEGTVPVVNGAEPDALTASVLIQACAAFLGTLGFAVLFGVPRRNYLQTALIATLGWMAYLLVLRCSSLGAVGATLFATMMVTCLARWAARLFKTPKTVYLITGIFPVIPGGGIFWTTFFLVSRRMDMALHSGAVAIACTAAIVLGIVLVSVISEKRKRV